MSRTDSVTVMVAVRDGERYLREALDSILGQTVSPHEVIVVDDASTDSTPAILDSYGDAIRVLHQAGHGQFAAVNRAAEVATGRIFGFLDADDVWTPRSLEVRLDRFGEDETLDAVFGMIQQFVTPEDDAPKRFRFDPDPAPVMLFQTMLVRHEAFRRIGPLEEDYATSANIEWISRLRTAGLRTATVPEVVSRRRLHRDNVSLTRVDSKRSDLLRAVRVHRRRTQPPP